MRKSIYHKNLANTTRRKHHLPLIVFLLIVLLSSGILQSMPKAGSLVVPGIEAQEAQFTGFEEYLDSIRQALKIPGMSAAIVQDQELVWAAGFGYANLEDQVAATPDTPYGLASVTKPIGAVIIMQLVEQGLVDLDAPIIQYGVNLIDDNITVRHLLTHTSEGVPGTEHHYNGDRYGYLGGVLVTASGKTFAALLSENILLPLGMENTALNPFNSWGGPSHYFMEDLKMGLGWGDNYQHYLDVYARLAKPYQLDEVYNIIPGMYQTYHNPAAGLLSSVTDLAKFDIALDQGLLLGDAAKNEMFSAAISTYRDRTDLNYGLGWYVQDFEGLRLLWHTGRWPPSTSALYLKIPEKNLTFIVLANTDNLTVPFAGLGNGDVSQSALALAFFRYFVFPEQHGYDLPSIDWRADQEVLFQQLVDVEDESTQEFLERELWSFRQVFASSGQLDQAEMLNQLDIKVFPGSTFRSNWMFTQISGPRTAAPPATPASAFVWFNRGAVLWFVMVILSAIWMAIRLLRAGEFTRWGKFLWLLTAFVLGPCAILVYKNLRAQTDETRQSNWNRVWGGAALSATGYAIAWSLAISILISMGDEAHPLAILGVTYLLPLLFGLAFVRLPLLTWNGSQKIWPTIRRSILAEVIMFNLGFATFFLLTSLVGNRILGWLPHPSSIFFWPMISFITVVSVPILTPLQYWILKRGFSLPSGLATAQTQPETLPDLRTTWPALIATFVIMIAALAITIAQIG